MNKLEHISFHSILVVLCLVVMTSYIAVTGSIIAEYKKHVMEVDKELYFFYVKLNDHMDKQKAWSEEIDSRLAQAEHDILIAQLRLDNHNKRLKEVILNQMQDEKVIKVATPTPVRRKGLNLSEKEIRDIAALVYLEVGAQSYRCQKAVASVVINRMKRYHYTVYQTIHQSGVFGPANRVPYTTPSQSCLKAVRDVIRNGTTLPSNVLVFRNNHYHTFGRPYCRIDGVYFSRM